MNHEMILWLLILIPALSGFVCLLMPSLKTALGVMCAGVFGAAIIGLFAITDVFFGHHILYASSQWFFMDALSAYHYFVMLLIFCLSSVYSCVYFSAEMEHHDLTIKQIRLFTCLWCEALTAMTIVLLSNNLGIMWVGIETTTLITAFLICIHVSRQSSGSHVEIYPDLFGRCCFRTLWVHCWPPLPPKGSHWVIIMLYFGQHFESMPHRLIRH